MTTTEKVNIAVHECLRNCYGSTDPIAAVAEYLAQLQDSVGWSTEEIHAVELAVLRMLGSMIKGAAQPAANAWLLSSRAGRITATMS